MLLSPDDGATISLQFGGDVMFGRRFYAATRTEPPATPSCNRVTEWRRTRRCCAASARCWATPT